MTVNSREDGLQIEADSSKLFFEKEVDIREILAIVWGGKLVVFFVVLLSAAVSVGVAVSLPDVYRAEALLASDEASGGGLSSQYSGLAGLAGISLVSDEVSEKAIAVAKLESRRFISDFIERHQILPELMAAKSFDWVSGAVSFDAKIYDSASDEWSRDVSPPRVAKPSLQEAYHEFDEVFDIDLNESSGFVLVSIEHVSPIVAARWVEWLIKDLNEELRREAIQEAQQSVDYLRRQLEETQVVALEEVFFSLIEEQMKTIVLANAREEYFFTTIDPAITPEEAAAPQRALICILGTMLGCVLGILLVLVRHYARFSGKHSDGVD